MVYEDWAVSGYDWQLPLVGISDDYRVMMCCDTQTEAAVVAVGDGYLRSETARLVHTWKNKYADWFCLCYLFAWWLTLPLVPPTPSLRDGVLNIICLSDLWNANLKPFYLKLLSRLSNHCVFLVLSSETLAATETLSSTFTIYGRWRCRCMHGYSPNGSLVKHLHRTDSVFVWTCILTEAEWVSVCVGSGVGKEV